MGEISRLYSEAEVSDLMAQAEVRAKIDEIQRFAEAAVEQQFRSIPAIQSYFMGRSVMLGMELLELHGPPLRKV